MSANMMPACCCRGEGVCTSGEILDVDFLSIYSCRITPDYTPEEFSENIGMGSTLMFSVDGSSTLYYGKIIAVGETTFDIDIGKRDYIRFRLPVLYQIRSYTRYDLTPCTACQFDPFYGTDEEWLGHFYARLSGGSNCEYNAATEDPSIPNAWITPSGRLPVHWEFEEITLKMFDLDSDNDQPVATTGTQTALWIDPTTKRWQMRISCLPPPPGASLNIFRGEHDGKAPDAQPFVGGGCDTTTSIQLDAVQLPIIL